MAGEPYLLFGDDANKVIYVGDELDVTLAGGTVVRVTVANGFLLRSEDHPEPFSPLRLGLIKAIHSRSRGWEHRW